MSSGGYTAALIGSLPLIDAGSRGAEVAMARARQQQLTQQERRIAQTVARDVLVAQSSLKAADCCPPCVEQFKKDPEKWIKNPTPPKPPAKGMGGQFSGPRPAKAVGGRLPLACPLQSVRGPGFRYISVRTNPSVNNPAATTSAEEYSLVAFCTQSITVGPTSPATPHASSTLP